MSKLFTSFLIPIVLAGISTCAVAQTATIDKDSLEQALNRATPEQRVDILNRLSYEYFDFNDSIATLFAKQALEEATRVNYAAGLQYAHTLIGVSYFTYGDYPTALEHFNLSHQYRTGGSLQRTIYNLMLKGNVQADLGYFDSSARQFDEGIRLMKEANDTRYLPGIYKGYARLKLATWENDEALRYVQLAREARKGEPEAQQRDLYLIFARVHLQMSNFTAAQEYIDEVCTLSEPLDDNFHKAMCHLVRADILYEQGHYPEALTACFRALDVSKVYEYHLLRATIYARLGETYTELAEYKLASDFLYRALNLAEADQLRPLASRLYTELAWVNKEMGSYDIAQDFAIRSVSMRRDMNDRKGVASALNVRGLILMLQKKYNEALNVHEQALAIRREINHREGISASLFNMALVYDQLRMFEKAIDLQLQALTIDEQIGNQQSVAISYNGLAALYIKTGNLNEADRYLSKVESILNVTKSKLLRKNYLQLRADLWEQRKDYKRALDFRKQYEATSDSIYSESSNMKLAEMQALYQVERKEQEIALLNKERDLQSNRIELQQSRIKNQNVVISLSTAAFLVSTIFILWIVRINRRLQRSKVELAEINEELGAQSEELRESNESLMHLNRQLSDQQEEIQAQSEELQESNESLVRLNENLIEKTEEVEAQSEELREANEAISSINQTLEQRVEERTQQLKQAYVELDTFFYRSSHDFRRPITTFIGLAEVAQITVKDENALDLFAKVKETAQALDKMIRKLQSISDVGAQELVYKDVLLKEMVENILVDFKDELNRKHIKVVQDIQLTKSFESYPALIRLIIENLIENAIQFCTPEAPYIRLAAQNKNGEVCITVEDNGQGIPDEYKDRIFDMYFRANVASKGNGLGLYIVKKAIDNLGGRIDFTTRLHGGSVFTVMLPSSQA